MHQTDKSNTFIYTAGQEKQHSISHFFENNRSLQMLRSLNQQKDLLQVCDENITDLVGSLKEKNLPTYEKKQQPTRPQQNQMSLASIQARLEQLIRIPFNLFQSQLSQQSSQQVEVENDDEDYEDVDDEDEEYQFNEEDIDEEDSNSHN